MSRKYSDAHKEFIRRHSEGVLTKDLTEMINKKFKTSFTISGIRSLRYKLGCKSGTIGAHGPNKGSFKKGHTPHNKGKKWDEYMPPEAQANARKTTFQKGLIPHNHRPIGSERLDKDGYTLVKVAENKWELKHRLIHEKNFGSIPKGKKVIFLDGNKQNFDLDNLALVTPAEMLVLNGRGLISEEPKITKTSITLAKVILKQAELLKKIKVGEK